MWWWWCLVELIYQMYVTMSCNDCNQATTSELTKESMNYAVSLSRSIQANIYLGLIIKMLQPCVLNYFPGHNHTHSQGERVMVRIIHGNEVGCNTKVPAVLCYATVQPKQQQVKYLFNKVRAISDGPGHTGPGPDLMLLANKIVPIFIE